jgi:hypothetical protein
MGHGGIGSYHDVQVRVYHKLNQGYPPGIRGDEIQEQMPLREFLGRLFKEGREVENELYRVSKCFAGGHGYNDNELERICDIYDAMYSKLFRQGKMVLPQHRHYIGGIDPYQERQQLMANQSDDQRRRERAMMMQQQVSFQPSPGQFHGIMQEDPSIKQMHKVALEKDKITQAKKKRDDDIYYLLT